MGEYVDYFGDLRAYKRLYALMVLVHQKVVPRLPKEEKFNLCDQLRRASQAAPALLAEGFAKRFQPRHWDKYFVDCIGEIQEMIHHMSCVRDVYQQYVERSLAEEIIEDYKHALAQVHALNKSFRSRKQCV